jgi:hypothetical protein
MILIHNVSQEKWCEANQPMAMDASESVLSRPANQAALFVIFDPSARDLRHGLASLTNEVNLITMYSTSMECRLSTAGIDRSLV